MKKLIATFVILTALPLAFAAEESGSGKAKPNPAAVDTVSVRTLQLQQERAQIVDTVNMFNNAAIQNDIKTMDHVLAHNYVAVDGNSGRTTKSDLLRAHREGLIRYTSVNTHDVDIQINGDTAIEKDVADVQGSWKGQAFSGSFASVRTLKKHNGQWQIVAFQVFESK